MINAIIGSSVFGLPSVIGGKLGAASPWAWLLAAVGIGVIMACFAEVASRFGEAGGPYLYAHVAFGRFAGIEMGWLLYLTRVTAAATNANLFVAYLGEFWPGASAPLATTLILGALIGALTLVNYRGVAGGARTSNLFAIAKLVPLGLFIAAGVVFVMQGGGIEPATVPAPLTTWLEAILLLCFAYGGFEAALMPLGEARDPRRDAPFALFAALGVVTLTYTLVQFVVMHLLQDPASAARPVSAAAGAMLGSGAARVMALVAMVSVSGYLAGATLNVPRLTFAMAERKDLPAVFGRIHPRFLTPHVSLLCFSVLTWGLASAGSFLQNLTLSAVSRLLTYGIVCAALIRYRRSELAPPPVFHLPAGTMLACLGLLFSFAVATRMTGREGLILAATLGIGLVNWWAVRVRGDPVTQ